MKQEKIFRKVVRVGRGTKVIALPRDFEGEFAWIIREGNAVRVVPAEVK
ncbi:MAG: hypothetical protein QXG52_09275 [Candidatus Caldarchaeum sp.]